MHKINQYFNILKSITIRDLYKGKVKLHTSLHIGEKNRLFLQTDDKKLFIC